ncbi:MAG: prolipoprotein diacylglyceryl transferase [Clostridiales bacterium]|nr:prolipoprotein diacylglyceryl transferase [Clostridiales bacterium]
MNDIMGASDIAFPNLGIYLKNVPKFFSVFGFQIALYSIFIGLGVISGLLMAVHTAKKENANPDTVWDFFIYELVFSIIGARIYYVIFFWDLYKDNLLQIFNLRNGGLAIYGAVIAAFLTLYIFCRIKKQNFLQFADICMPGLILGQAIGRWGNFTNREVFGEYTNNLLAMRLPIDSVRSWDISANIAAHIPEGANYIQVHPTFLYESLWNLAILCLIILYRKYKKFDGEMCLLYLGGYGLGRFWIEGIRTDQLYIMGTHIPVSQVIALVCVIASVAADIVVRSKIKKKAVTADDESDKNA